MMALPRLCLAAVLAVAAAELTSAGPAAPAPPNILFFLADDMGYGDAGYLSTGSAHGKLLTPNLDDMVAAGMSFTDAYAGAPVCAPSRCTLITGQHSGHCSVRSNGPVLSSAEVGFPTVLRQHKYHTRHIGKWGLGGFGTGASPLDKGFEYFYGQLSQMFCHNYYPNHMDHGVLLPNGTQLTSEIPIPSNSNASETRCGPDRLQCTWSGDLWTAEALSFIKTAAAVAPWMMYLSYTAPHAGGVGTNTEGRACTSHLRINSLRFLTISKPDSRAAFVLPRAEPPVPRISSGPYWSNRAQLGKEIGYASAVTEIDRQLGLVLGSLETAKIAEQTVVFFASDNVRPPHLRENTAAG